MHRFACVVCGLRHPWHTATAMVGVAVAILFLSMAVTLAAARYYLYQGMAQLQTARLDATSFATGGQASNQAELRAHLGTARNAFAAARRFLWLTGPLLERSGWVPGIGGQLSGANPAADAAYDASNAAIHLESGLTPVLLTVTSPTRHGSLVQRVTPVLLREHTEFVAARDSAELAAHSAALVPVTGDPALNRARDKLLTYLPRLQQAAGWLALAPVLLGAARPSGYLFAWEDPMELRATGGFIGASDFITVRHGVLSHHFAGRVPSRREINTALLPLPEAAYTPETYWVFCDSNWSPDFPVSARLERWFYGEDTGRWAQYVIDFVDTAIPSILRATGPLYLRSYRGWVTSSNVIDLAQHYINGTYKGPARVGLRDTVRKQFFHHVMIALQRQVQTLPASRWPALIRVLGEAVAHRDILLYSEQPEVQRTIVQAGASGAFVSSPGDYLYVVDDNRSYNKINPYVHETVFHRTAGMSSGWYQESLAIRYHLDPSPASLEGYGPGLGRLSLRPGYGPSLGHIGTKHDYQDFLRVYVPAGSVLEQSTGFDVWAPEHGYGKTQFAGRVLVREGQTVTVHMRYRVPAPIALPYRGRYRLTVQHQPGSRIDTLQLIANLSGPGALEKRTVRFPKEDVQLGPPAPPATSGTTAVQLASTTDPYIDYSSLQDLRHPL